MAEELINKYIDRDSIKGDTDYFLNNIREVVTAIKNLSDTKVSLSRSSSLSDVTKFSKEAVAQLANVDKALGNVQEGFTELSPAIKQADTAIDQINSGLDEGARSLAELKLRATENAKAQKDLVKAYNEGLIGLKQYTETAGVLIQREQDLKAQIGDLTLQQKQFAKENNSVAGSADQAAVRLDRLRKEYSSLTDEEKANPFGKALKQSIDALDPAIKSADADLGKFQRNVGNYGGTFSGAFNVLKDDLIQIKEQLAGMSQSDAGFSQLSTRASLLEDVLVGVNQNFSSTRGELRAFQEAATKLGVTLGLTDEEFQKFNAAVGQGVNEIQDIKAATKFQASDTKGITGLIAAAQGLAGAYGVAQGAAQLFGSDNKELQESLNKMAAVMTLLQGLQAIQNALQKESGAVQLVLAARTGIVSAAQRIYQATMLSSIGATVALRIALVALTGGLFLLIPLLVSGASSLASYNQKQHDAELQQKALNDVNQKASEQYADQIVKLTSLKARFEETNATARTKKEVTEELNKTFGEYGVSLKDVNETERFLNEQADDFIKMLTIKTQATAALALATDAYKKVLEDQTKAPEELLGTWQKVGTGIKSVFSNIFNNSKSALELFHDDFSKAGEKTRNDQVDKDKAMYDKLITLATGFQNQVDGLSAKTKFGTLEKEKKKDNGVDKELVALYELERLKQQAEADSLKAIADNEKNGLDDRLSALQKYAALQALIIEKSAQHEIEVNKLTGNQALVVREKALQDIRKLNESVGAQALSLNQAEIERVRQQISQFGAQQRAERERLSAVRLAEETELQDKINAIGDATYEKEKKRREQDLADQKRADELKLEARKRLTDKEKELAQNIVDLTQTLFTDGYEREKNAIQAIEDANNERYSTEIKNVQASTLSEQDKAAKVAQLEAEQRQKQIQLDKQKRDVQVKEARVAKAAQAATIIATTAEAVIAALAPPPVGLGPVAGVPLAIVTGAIGAVQLAKVLATPIPQYAEGTEDHRGGKAVVGEGKNPELVQTPQGKSFVVDKPTLVDLPKHSKVIPLTQEFKSFTSTSSLNKLAANTLYQNSSNVTTILSNDNSVLVTSINNQTVQLRKAIMKSRANVNIHIKDKGKWDAYINSNIKGR